MLRRLMSSGPTLGYRPSLDGLRAIAIACVFVHHLGGLAFGGLGVDIFFVLSGFLITTLLLEEFRDTGQINLKQFYLRRAFRLLPALFCFLIVTVIYSRLFFSAQTAFETWRTAIYAVLYCANWMFAFGGKGSTLLGHLWSLAIEEQFYILWPATLMLLLTRFSRRSILITISILTVVICIHRTGLLVSGASVERIYDGSDTRADSILVGCLIAMFVTWRVIKPDRMWAKVCGFLSILVIIAYLLNLRSIPGQNIYSIGLTIFACANGFLILQIVTTPSGLIQRALELPPLVFIGKLSYSLYLWHVFAIYVMHSQVMPSIVFALVLASASYYLVERPFLRLKKRYASNATRHLATPQIWTLLPVTRTASND